MSSFYKSRDSEQVVWWATFNQQCIDHAATFASILTIGVLAQILACKNFIATVVNGADDAKNFGREVASFKNVYLDSPLGTPVPGLPVPPGGIVVPIGVVVGLEAFARQLAGQLNAHPSMTPAIRIAMGIVGTTDPFGTVEIVSAEGIGGSQVAMRLRLAGYPAVAVYRKRAGVVVRVGVSLTADFVDADDPIAAGVSESREYWIRGIVDNVEQGPISASVLVATTP
jgi:hypothetical protein